MLAMLRANAWAVTAFVWGVAEATLFFFVPDVLISFVGLRRGARAGLVASLAAAIGASVGGALMYLWSTSDPAAAERAVLAVPAISDVMAAAAHTAMQTQGWFAATLEGPLSRTPYKVYAIYAPHVGAGLIPFALASIVARLPRFLIAAFGAALARHWLGRFASETTLTWVLAAFWVVFYAVFFAVTPS
jgi:hypothetical protein